MVQIRQKKAKRPSGKGSEPSRGGGSPDFLLFSVHMVSVLFWFSFHYDFIVIIFIIFVCYFFLGAARRVGALRRAEQDVVGLEVAVDHLGGV